MHDVLMVTQELYEKSLVRVEDGSLPADLLEIRTFLTVPQVDALTHTHLSFSSAAAHFISCLFTLVTVYFQNLVKVMTLCQRNDLVSVHISRLQLK